MKKFQFILIILILFAGSNANATDRLLIYPSYISVVNNIEDSIENVCHEALTNKFMKTQSCVSTELAKLQTHLLSGKLQADVGGMNCCTMTGTVDSKEIKAEVSEGKVISLTSGPYAFVSSQFTRIDSKWIMVHIQNKNLESVTAKFNDKDEIIIENAKFTNVTVNTNLKALFESYGVSYSANQIPMILNEVFKVTFFKLPPSYKFGYDNVTLVVGELYRCLTSEAKLIELVETYFHNREDKSE